VEQLQQHGEHNGDGAAESAPQRSSTTMVRLVHRQLLQENL
jgi:hypothetical protein